MVWRQVDPAVSKAVRPILRTSSTDRQVRSNPPHEDCAYGSQLLGCRFHPPRRHLLYSIHPVLSNRKPVFQKALHESLMLAVIA